MSPRLVRLDRTLLARAVEEERDPLTAEMAAAPHFLAHAIDGGPCYGVLDGAAFVAAGGLLVFWAGRAEAWALASRFASRRQLVAAVRLGRRVLDMRQRDPLFRRIDAYVRADEPWTESFAHALGFRRCALLRAWDAAGRDYILFERLAGETT